MILINAKTFLDEQKLIICELNINYHTKHFSI